MNEITNTIIKTDECINHIHTSRWNRKYNDISALYYYQTITMWETKDKTIQESLDSGNIVDTTNSYKIIKPLIWTKRRIHLDKTLEFSDADDSKIDNCRIMIKQSEGYPVFLLPEYGKQIFYGETK